MGCLYKRRPVSAIIVMLYCSLSELNDPWLQAVNELFKKIYQDGNDDVRKAMNKSFLESGGTVLSTNWGDVSKKTVDVKPPQGTEFKKFDWKDYVFSFLFLSEGSNLSSRISRRTTSLYMTEDEKPCSFTEQTFLKCEIPSAYTYVHPLGSFLGSVLRAVFKFPS